METSLATFLDEWNNASDCVLVHTSGSTGRPKPMWVEKRKMLNSARITCDFLGLKAGDTALLCMPLDYIAGKMVVVRSIERGMRLITVKPSNHPLADISETPTFAAMVPSQVFCSLQVPEERERLAGIKHLIIGGGAITHELQAALNELYHEQQAASNEMYHEQQTILNDTSSFTPSLSHSFTSRSGVIWSTYGMTETLSHIALRRLNGPDASEWYTPFDSVHISLNAEGCLVIDAPLVHDGPLVTNDIAEIRHDGCFRIKGRKDNVICSGGIKLQIEEIEDKLRPHIATPFCITKRADEKFGEVAVLLIADHEASLAATAHSSDFSYTPAATAQSPECPHSLAEAFAHLSKYEVPKIVIHVDAIPMTATSKIDRHKTAATASDGGKILTTQTL